MFSLFVKIDCLYQWYLMIWFDKVNLFFMGSRANFKFDKMNCIRAIIRSITPLDCILLKPKIDSGNFNWTERGWRERKWQIVSSLTDARNQDYCILKKIRFMFDAHSIWIVNTQTQTCFTWWKNPLFYELMARKSRHTYRFTAKIVFVGLKLGVWFHRTFDEK